LEGDAARATDQMLPPAYRARVSNIDHGRSKKNPVRMGFQTGQAEVVVASHDAQEAPSGTVPPAPPDDSSVSDIGYKASVDKNPPGVNRRA
jgi:hypothetical protein